MGILADLLVLTSLATNDNNVSYMATRLHCVHQLMEVLFLDKNASDLRIDEDVLNSVLPESIVK